MHYNASWGMFCDLVERGPAVFSGAQAVCGLMGLMIGAYGFAAVELDWRLDVVPQ